MPLLNGMLILNWVHNTMERASEPARCFSMHGHPRPGTHHMISIVYPTKSGRYPRSIHMQPNYAV